MPSSFVSGSTDITWTDAVSRSANLEISGLSLLGHSEEFGRIEMNDARFRKISGDLNAAPNDSLAVSVVTMPFDITVDGNRWYMSSQQSAVLSGLVSQILPYNQKHEYNGQPVEFYDVFGRLMGRLIHMEFMPLYSADFGLNESIFGLALNTEYPVTMEQNAARHILHHNEQHRDLFLGEGFNSAQLFVRNMRSTNPASKTSSLNTDGITFLTPVRAAASATIQVEATEAGYLNAWFDWNRDGQWTIDEQVISGKVISKGLTEVTIQVPSGVTAGESYARFRICDCPDIYVTTGAISGGEVEDHLVTIDAVGKVVSGKVWSDKNGNGVQDSDEQGLSGVKLFADLNRNSIHDESEPWAVSDQLGNYSLGGLPVGEVRIHVDTADEWSVTNTSGNAYVNVTLSNSSTNATLSFGLNRISTALDDDHLLPREFGLDQNYPNPFNPSTTIRYRLAEAAPVQLTVFDMNGRIVANLVHSTQSAGEYSVAFDASSLASGVYVYRLVAGSHVFTKKLTLIK